MISHTIYNICITKNVIFTARKKGANREELNSHTKLTPKLQIQLSILFLGENWHLQG